MSGNRIAGGGAGITVLRGSPSFVDNTIDEVGGFGIVVGGGTSPSLSGNSSCGNGTNLKLFDGATPEIDDTNEICGDAPLADNG